MHWIYRVLFGLVEPESAAMEDAFEVSGEAKAFVDDAKHHCRCLVLHAGQEAEDAGFGLARNQCKHANQDIYMSRIDFVDNLSSTCN